MKKGVILSRKLKNIPGELVTTCIHKYVVLNEAMAIQPMYVDFNSMLRPTVPSWYHVQ